jgi:hypothetical protein
MSSRALVRLEDVAALDHLAWAFWRAARGKRRRPDVRAFESRLDHELAALSRDILDGSVAVGAMRVFEIRDPKRRTIHAPCFRERVLHHALMAFSCPALERYLVADTFACRPGKGTLAAVRRAQGHCRRFAYFAKLDVKAYFASIDHAVLRGLLRRRIKGSRALALLERILAGHEAARGRGLPIGALTSQHFANLYLGDLDRRILAKGGLGLVRYMDDIVVCGHERGAVHAAAEGAVTLARDRLKLEIKPGWKVHRMDRGLPLCGFEVYTDRLLLSRRRKRRYRLARRRWERAYAGGRVCARALQAGYASALAICSHAHSLAWRRRDLAVRPAPDA